MAVFADHKIIIVDLLTGVGVGVAVLLSSELVVIVFKLSNNFWLITDVASIPFAFLYSITALRVFCPAIPSGVPHWYPFELRSSCICFIVSVSVISTSGVWGGSTNLHRLSKRYCPSETVTYLWPSKLSFDIISVSYTHLYGDKHWSFSVRFWKRR